MPRTVRDANLENRTARSRLKAGTKPHFRLLEPGLHLGYRKLTSGPGTWVVRRYAGKRHYQVKNLRTPTGAVIIADDFADADGNAILSFKQAQESARTNRPAERAPAPAYTVAMAMDDYLTFLERDGRTAHALKDTRYRFSIIRPELGAVALKDLTADRLQAWREALVRTRPRLRTPKGAPQKYSDVVDLRARRATVNRAWKSLRAALNLAYRAGKVDSDKAWRHVKPFRGVERARNRYLTVAQCKRLMNTCGPDFRLMVQGALLTGARYGQLAELTVGDFNPDTGTVQLRTRKGDGQERTYHAYLSDEGRSFFASACAGRANARALVFRKADGEPWGKSEQTDRMVVASAAARIEPHASFHLLRHTWASLSVMAGMPLMVVARNLGHSDTRMVELHYGHLAPGYVADAVRAGAPRFDIKTSVRPLR